jgi:hypothetical protein
LRGGGLLHVTEESRGLLNQAGQRRRPSLDDLRAYFAPRATATTARPTDVFVELDSPSVAAVQLWEDARAVHAEVHLKRPSLAEVQEALVFHRPRRRRPRRARRPVSGGAFSPG